MLVTIVCIGVALVIFTAVLRLSFMERRSVEAQTWKAQAAWLVESGLERAAARLAADPDYQGETWQISAEALGAKSGAVVEIEIQNVPEQPQRRAVRVRADYPDDPQHRARQTKQLVIELRPSS